MWLFFIGYIDISKNKFLKVVSIPTSKGDMSSDTGNSASNDRDITQGVKMKDLEAKSYQPHNNSIYSTTV